MKKRIVRDSDYLSLDKVGRFSRNVIEKSGDECWGWNGSKDSKGYGRFTFKGKMILAHRCSYELHVGKIPEGLVIDHLCNNTSCANPMHLEPKTIYENVKRGFIKKVLNPVRVGKICKNGHMVNNETIRTTKTGSKYCLVCSRMQSVEKRKNEKLQKVLLFIHTYDMYINRKMD